MKSIIFILLSSLVLQSCGDITLFADDAYASSYEDRVLESNIRYEGSFPVFISTGKMSKMCDLTEGNLIYVLTWNDSVHFQVIKDGCDKIDEY